MVHSIWCVVRLLRTFPNQLTNLSSTEIQSKKVVNNVDFGDINTKGKVVIIVAGVLSTIVCLTSLFG